MLGVEVLRELLNKNTSLYATIRNISDKNKIKNYLNSDISKIKFYKFKIKKNYEKNLEKIVRNKHIVINCIGVIKPYINENNEKSVSNALNINSIFPHVLKSKLSKNSKVYQIATDCVFNGDKGWYNENVSHNANDIYGKTKSLGEVKSDNFYNIRCSIIGKEIKNFNSLLCWFLNQKKNSTIFGFKNHLWNGITTSYFAKVISVIIHKNIKIPNLIHIIPDDTVNKYELLKLFQSRFKRNDIKIKKISAKTVVNRTLSTNYKNINKIIHKKIGLKGPIKIKKMVNMII